MILETSLQAQFLIPMAVSLGFGVAFATAITLLLVPSLYRILEDYHRLAARRRAAPGEAPEEAPLPGEVAALAAAREDPGA